MGWRPAAAAPPQNPVCVCVCALHDLADEGCEKCSCTSTEQRTCTLCRARRCCWRLPLSGLKEREREDRAAGGGVEQSRGGGKEGKEREVARQRREERNDDSERGERGGLIRVDWWRFR